MFEELWLAHPVHGPTMQSKNTIKIAPEQGGVREIAHTDLSYVQCDQIAGTVRGTPGGCRPSFPSSCGNKDR